LVHSPAGTDYLLRYLANGTYVDNITIDATADYVDAVWINVTAKNPTHYFIVDLTNEKIYLLNSAGVIIDSWSTLTEGYNDLSGITSQARNAFVDNIYIVDSVDGEWARYFYRRTDYAVLATNETGTWQNKTGSYGSPADVDGTGQWIWGNFTWLNSSVCSKLLGWKVWVNDTYGDWNVTGIKTQYLRPYLYNSTNTTVISEIDTCVDKHNFTLKASVAGEATLYINASYIVEDSVSECIYEATNAELIEQYNQTGYCEIVVKTKSLSAGDVVRLQKSTALKVAPPPNIPAAIGAAAVGIIIVI